VPPEVLDRLAGAEAALAAAGTAAPERERRLAEAGEAALRSELLGDRSATAGAGGASVELIELRRDRRLAEAGEAGLREALRAAVGPGAAAAALAGTRFATLLADRDGTVLPYFSRYLASVQPAWAALWLTRFARRCSGHAVVLTAGPLEGPGVLDLAVAPEDAFVYAASKGREWKAPGRPPHRTPLAPEQAERMARLVEALEALLERPAHRRFRSIGSGFQRKYGQVTVARQDIGDSISHPDSRGLLDELQALVSHLDPDRAWFALSDTGFDVEVHLRDAAGEAFDKGDGVRLLEAELPLGLGAGSALVCGDTLADVAMLEAAAERAPEARALFVARPADPGRDELMRAVRKLDAAAVFVDSPEALLLLLDELSSG